MERKERKKLIKSLCEEYKSARKFYTYADSVKKVKTNEKTTLTGDEIVQLEVLKKFVVEKKLSPLEIEDVVMANKRKLPFLNYCIKIDKKFISQFKEYCAIANNMRYFRWKADLIKIHKKKTKELLNL